MLEIAQAVGGLLLVLVGVALYAFMLFLLAVWLVKRGGL